MRRDFDDLPLEHGDETLPAISSPPPPPDREARTSPALWIAIAAAMLLVAVFAAWKWLRPGDSSIPPPAVGAAATTAPEPRPTPAPRDDLAIGPLPPLDGSDAFVRDLLARLSERPELAAWLAPDHLVRRFVATVDNIADGVSPAPHLAHLRPQEGFTARNAEGRWVADTKGHRRYEALTSTFVDLDSEQTANLYRALRSLCDEAYRELGYPGRTFDQTLAAAIDRLLAVALPDRPPELVAQATVFVYADPTLEQLPAAEKQLLRLGPANARRVQAKLRELAQALGLPNPN